MIGLTILFWLQSGKDGCYVKSGLSLDGETGFSAIMHKKIIPVFSLFPCIKIHIASRLRDLQSYHFDKTTESKQIHPYQGRLAVPGHLAVLAAAVVFVLGVSCAAAQWCQLWRFSNDNMKLFESIVSGTS